MKSLGPLVNKVKEIQVETIVDTLCSNMISNNEQLRDISSIGLKTVIAELSPNSTNLVSTICKKITGRLANAISQVCTIAIICFSLYFINI
jgi:cullin-associated NEDD8-dissociated protein 1